MRPIRKGEAKVWAPNQEKATGLKSMANPEKSQGHAESRIAVPSLLRMPFVPEALNVGLRIRLVLRPCRRSQGWGQGAGGWRRVSAGLPALDYTPALPAPPMQAMCSLYTSASSQKKPFVFSWQNWDPVIKVHMQSCYLQRTVVF